MEEVLDRWMEETYRKHLIGRTCWTRELWASMKTSAQHSLKSKPKASGKKHCLWEVVTESNFWIRFYVRTYWRKHGTRSGLYHLWFLTTAEYLGIPCDNTPYYHLDIQRRNRISPSGECTMTLELKPKVNFSSMSRLPFSLLDLQNLCPYEPTTSPGIYESVPMTMLFKLSQGEITEESGLVCNGWNFRYEESTSRVKAQCLWRKTFLRWLTEGAWEQCVHPESVHF